MKDFIKIKGFLKMKFFIKIKIISQYESFHKNQNSYLEFFKDESIHDWKKNIILQKKLFILYGWKKL